MDMNKNHAPESKPDAGRTAGLKKLRRVMLIVLILCGGNAIGILLGVCWWKKTGSKPMGVLIMLAVTLAAFLVVMAMSLRSLNRAKSAAQGES